VIAAHLGKKASDETRRKLSEAQRPRGARPPKAGRPWTAEEDALVRQLPPGEVAGRTGRTMKAVLSRRRLLKVPDRRTRESRARKAARNAAQGPGSRDPEGGPDA
jgi:hypothetical protein